MGRRSKNDGIPVMLLEALEFVFQFIPPWTSIPFAAVGFFLIVLFWDAQVKIPVLQILGLMFGTGFAIICLIAGWKGAKSDDANGNSCRQTLTWIGFAE